MSRLFYLQYFRPPPFGSFPPRVNQATHCGHPCGGRGVAGDLAFADVWYRPVVFASGGKSTFSGLLVLSVSWFKSNISKLLLVWSWSEFYGHCGYLKVLLEPIMPLWSSGANNASLPVQICSGKSYTSEQRSCHISAGAFFFSFLTFFYFKVLNPTL